MVRQEKKREDQRCEEKRIKRIEDGVTRRDKTRHKNGKTRQDNHKTRPPQENRRGRDPDACKKWAWIPTPYGGINFSKTNHLHLKKK
jgi:hypothetical protein